jgi:hypothetical protein
MELHAPLLLLLLQRQDPDRGCVKFQTARGFFFISTIDITQAYFCSEGSDVALFLIDVGNWEQSLSQGNLCCIKKTCQLPRFQ